MRRRIVNGTVKKFTRRRYGRNKYPIEGKKDYKSYEKGYNPVSGDNHYFTLVCFHHITITFKNQFSLKV
jgi:hypothetical protein